MSPCCWLGVEAEAAVAMVARVQMVEEVVGYPAEEVAVASCSLEEAADLNCNHDSPTILLGNTLMCNCSSTTRVHLGLFNVFVGGLEYSDKHPLQRSESG